MTTNEILSNVYVINLDIREDRRRQVRGEFTAAGIRSYGRFSAHADVNGAYGNTKSFCGLIDRCLSLDSSGCLIFEDDVIFMPSQTPFAVEIAGALNELPDNWDALYLGATLCDNYVTQPITNYSEHLYRLWSSFAAHAIIFSKQGLKNIRSRFSPSEGWWQEVLVKTDGYAFDVFLAKEFLPTANCYITKKILCGQRPGWSNLLNKNTDYNKLMSARFEYYKNKLK